MRRHISLGSIYGIELKLHYSWFFIVALLAWSLAATYYPEHVAGQTQTMYVLLGLTSAVLLFVSVLLHELAHSLVARYFDIPVHGISLFFFGGVSQIPDEHTSPRAEGLLAAAGPAFSFLLGALLFAGLPFIAPVTWNALVQYLATINVILGTFNLMPAFPLDGGRILRALLWWKTGDFTLATTVAAKSGKFFAGMLIFLGVFGLVSGQVPGSSMWFILLGGFLWFLAEASYEQVYVRKALTAVKVREVVDKKPITIREDDLLANVVERIIHDPHDAYLVMDGKRCVGVLKRACVSKVQPSAREGMRVQDVMEAVPFTARPSEKVYDLLMKMVERRVPLVPVLYRKRFVGVVRQEDIIAYLRLHGLK